MPTETDTFMATDLTPILALPPDLARRVENVSWSFARVEELIGRLVDDAGSVMAEVEEHCSRVDDRLEALHQDPEVAYVPERTLPHLASVVALSDQLFDLAHKIEGLWLKVEDEDDEHEP